MRLSLLVPSFFYRKLFRQQWESSHSHFWPITTIISGGQSGVDRAALDTAIALGLPHGGFCPRGRKAEDGPIAEKYKLKETLSKSYLPRTKNNILASDGTLLFYRKELSGGSLMTCRLAKRHKKPLLAIDINLWQPIAWKSSFYSFIIKHNLHILNVAGPRESQAKGIYKTSYRLLILLLRQLPP